MELFGFKYFQLFLVLLWSILNVLTGFLSFSMEQSNVMKPDNHLHNNYRWELIKLNSLGIAKDIDDDSMGTHLLTLLVKST